MNRWKLLVILGIIAIASCRMMPEYPVFETEEDVFDWVNDNMTYISDGGSILSEFRPVSDILETMEGDCSQYAIITICLLDWSLGINADLVAIVTKSGLFHAVIMIDGELVDPGSPSQWSWIDYTVFAIISHGIVMDLYGK